jgi:RNA polymerase sigma-70 factor, ECF subfamily
MPTDEALYLQVIEGDITAFDELYRRYEGRLFGFIRRQLGDAGEAEDVFHEAFMAVLKERKTRKELAHFGTWLFQVARNLCLNRNRARKSAARALEARTTLGESAPTAEHVLEVRELPDALERAVANLPLPLAQLYSLRVSGLSYAEIAATLGIPLGTVKSRMHDLIARLRKELQPWIAP